MVIENAFFKNSLRELKISHLYTISLDEIVKTNWISHALQN